MVVAKDRLFENHYDNRHQCDTLRTDTMQDQSTEQIDHDTIQIREALTWLLQ